MNTVNISFLTDRIQSKGVDFERVETYGLFLDQIISILPRLDLIQTLQ